MIEIVNIFMTVIMPSAFGGAVRASVGLSKSKKALDIRKALLTIIASIAVGIFAGLILGGGDWIISALAGYAGSDLIEGLYKSRFFNFLKFSK